MNRKPASKRAPAADPKALEACASFQAPAARSEADPLPSQREGVAGPSTGEPGTAERHPESEPTQDQGAE